MSKKNNLSNPYEFFQFLFTFLKISFLKKNRDYNLAIVSSIFRKIRVRVIKSWKKNISEIGNVRFIFQKRKKISKRIKDCENSIKAFKIEKRIGHLIIYGTIYVFWHIYFLKSLIWHYQETRYFLKAKLFFFKFKKFQKSKIFSKSQNPLSSNKRRGSPSTPSHSCNLKKKF